MKKSKELIELEIVNAYIDGVAISDIVGKFNIGRCSIYSYLKKHGVSPNRKEISKEKRKELIDLYNAGVKLKDINSQYGKHADSLIYRSIKGNRNSSLNKDGKKFIDENINNMKQKDIAKELGVAPATICYYKNKKKE